MKVTRKNLNKDGVWGWAHVNSNEIEIHKGVTGKRHLLYIIHEALHIIDPDLSETKVRRMASRLTAVLWKEKFRRTEI